MNIPELDMDPFSEEVLTDPTEFHTRVREAGPVVKLRQSEGHDIVGVGGHAVANEVWENHEDFISGRGGGILDLARDEPHRPPGVLLESDPPYHDHVRAVAGEIISPRHLRGLRTSFQASADALMDRLLEKGDINGHIDLGQEYPMEVIPGAIMGTTPGDETRDNIVRYSTWLFEAMGPQTPRARSVIENVENVDGAKAWVAASCEREHVAPDSIGAKMWEAVDRGVITEFEAGNMTRSLISAGVDSTIYALGMTINLLLDNPDQYARLHDDPDLGKFAFDESIRLSPPNRQVWRTPSRDLELEGVPLREEQKVMLVLGAIGRDPERWGPTVDQYDIGRDTGGNLSFGRGVHACVGAPIARLEADILLSTFARRVTSIERTGESVPYVNNSIRGWIDIPMRLHAA